MGLKVYATSATEAKDKAIVACGLQSATKYLWDSEHYRARHCLGNTCQGIGQKSLCVVRKHRRRPLYLIQDCSLAEKEFAVSAQPHPKCSCSSVIWWV